MDSTSASLLLRVREATDGPSWQRFVDMYTPMIYRWAVGIGLPKSESSDLVQDVLVTVCEKMHSFEYREGGSFRAWLKTVTLNRAKSFLIKRARRQELWDKSHQAVSVDIDQVEFLSQQEYNAALTQRALEIMQTEFEESTWRACWQSIVEGRKGSEIAAALGLSENAVYLAKARVLRRLRTELQGLLDE